MTDGPEWFAPKRFGYGVGLPISWQGWALTIGLVAMVAGLGLRFEDKPLVMVAIFAPLMTTFLVIAARTTRGGWRWRWGKED